jgi:hypothetical protein
MDYKQLKNISIEQKRKDLYNHPLIDEEAIKNDSDEFIEEVYLVLFSSIDQEPRDVIIESDEDWN